MTIAPPAFLLERIRLLTAFADDLMITLTELDPEVAQRLNDRWFDVTSVRRPRAEDMSPTEGTEPS